MFSTTADFLTSLCDPNARQFQPGREASTPKTPEELEAVFKKSDTYQRILRDVDAYEKELQETGQADTLRFQKTVAECTYRLSISLSVLTNNPSQEQNRPQKVQLHSFLPSTGRRMCTAGVLAPLGRQDLALH